MRSGAVMPMILYLAMPAALAAKQEQNKAVQGTRALFQTKESFIYSGKVIWGLTLPPIKADN